MFHWGPSDILSCHNIERVIEIIRVVLLYILGAGNPNVGIESYFLDNLCSKVIECMSVLK